MSDPLADAMDAASAPSAGSDPLADAMDNAKDPQSAAPAPPPPRRGLGPPRPHGQTGMPRPHPAGVPPPPEDLSAGAVLHGALENLGPSIGGQIQQAISPLLHPRTAISAFNDLAVAGEAGLGLIDKGDEAARARDFTPMRSLGHMYAQRYDPKRWSAPGGLLSTLKHDPAAVGTDLAVPLSMGAGSEALLTKLGLPGELASGIAKGAGTAEAIVNPVGYIPRAIGLAAKGPIAAIRAVRGAGAAGSPVVKTLQGLDETTPIARSIIEGVAPAPEHAVEVGQNIAGWRQKVAKAATDLTGDVDQDGPHPTNLGQELENRQIGAHNAANANYDTLRAHTGEFHPSFAPTLRGAVDSAFRGANLPPTTGAGSIGALTGTFGRTAQAMKGMHDQIDSLAAANQLTASHLMNVRQEIGSYYKGASGADTKGLRTLQEALDNHIHDQASQGAFSGSRTMADDMRKAIDGWRTYQNTFHEGPVAKIVQTLRDGQTADHRGRLSPSGPGVTEAATSQLGKALINKNLTTPGGAPRLYNDVSRIMGGSGAGQDALDNYVRHTVTNTDSAGNLIAKPEQMHGFLNSTMSRSVFPDPHHARMREFANAERALTAKAPRGAREAGLVKTITRHLGAQALRGGAAWLGETASPLPHPLGALAGYGAEQAAEAAMKAARRRKAFLPAANAARRANWATRTARRGAASSMLYGATPQTAAEQRHEAEQDDRDIVAKAPAVEEVAKAASRENVPATPTDIDTAVRLVAAEGDPNPEGWKAVAAVMRNRSLASGHTLAEIAAAPGQFEGYGGKNYVAARPGTPQYERILAAIAPVLAGKEDPTNGADSFYAPELQRKLGRKPPSWDHGDGQMIGTQRFFKGKYRRPHAAGGAVLDLTKHLLNRAEQAQKAAQSSTKPLLGLSDDTVAQALRVAQRGL